LAASHFGERAVFGWCFGVLIGGLAQLAIQLPSLWNIGFNFTAGLTFVIRVCAP